MGFRTLGFSRTRLTNLMSKFEIKNGGCQYGKQNVENDFIYFIEIRYSEAFEVADYTSEFEIQNGESSLIHQMQKVTRFGWNFVLAGFWGRWLCIWSRNLKLKIADTMWLTKIQQVTWFVYNSVVAGFRWFCGYLIMLDHSFGIWCWFLDNISHLKKNGKKSDFNSVLFHFSLVTS